MLNVYHGSVTLLLSINKEESESDQGNTEVVNKLGKDMSWAQNFEYTLGIYKGVEFRMAATMHAGISDAFPSAYARPLLNSA